MRAAVIGCGRMGAQPSSRSAGQLPPGWAPIAHAEAFAAVPGIELAALCDSSEEVVRRWGAHYGVTGQFTDYRELLARCRPDIVSIATRTPAKADIIRSACEHGVKGLYVEKPLANSLAGCRALLEEIARARIVLAYGVNRRYHAAYREARRLIEAGAIGAVSSVVIELGTSPLLWTHPHSVDLMLFLLGSTDFTGVQARARPGSLTLADPRRVDSDPVIESAMFTFASGAIGHIVTVGGLGVRIGGKDGVLTIHANGAGLQLDSRDSAESPYFLRHQQLPVPAGDGATVYALTQLRDALAGHGPAGISPQEIETGMAMLMGCAWSAANDGRYVERAQIPAELVVTGRSGELYA